ncbi:MAG: hypothetical protein QXL79_03535 [Sulfolobales archaeon]
MPNGVAEALTNWLPVLYLAISLALIYFVYHAAKLSLSKLRLKGIISRKFEETAKLIALAVTAIIVLPAAISALVPHPLVPTVSLAVSLIVVAVVLFSIIGYVANSLSYLIIALTSTVRDGEYVRVLVDGREYEGRALLVEGNYMVLKTEPGTSIMIPYSRLLRSVIIKLSQVPLVLRIKVVKPGGDIDEVVEKVASAIRKSKLVNKTSISVKPVEVSEDGVVLVAEAEAVNPKNVNDCFEDLVKILMKELPYKVSIEVVSGRSAQTH